jgi:hypothetical protein
MRDLNAWLQTSLSGWHVAWGPPNAWILRGLVKKSRLRGEKEMLGRQ